MNVLRPRLGWRQDLEDHDALAAEAIDFRIGRGDFEAPEEIDPRAWMQIENQGQMGSCFPAGTLVRTADGEQVPIEQLRLLVHVRTAEGNTGPITKLMCRENSGPLIRMKLWGHRHLIATPEHPVFTQRGYVPIADLKKGDWAGIPRVTGGESRAVQTANHLEIRHRVLPDRTWTTGSVRGRGSLSIQSKAVPDVIGLNRGFGRIVGLFLAEGNTTRSKVCWTFSRDEELTLAAELQGLLLSELGVESSLRRSSKSRAIQVRIYGVQWASLFESLCSTGSRNKVMHRDIASGCSEFQEGVLSGWIDGDGFTHKRGHVSGCTVSKQLAHQMFDIGAALGMRPAISVRQQKPSHGVKKRLPSWTVSFPVTRADTYRSQETESHLWRAVVGVDEIPFRGNVFNLSVEGDESYVANGIGVHNCAGHARSTVMEYINWIDTRGQVIQLSRMYAYLTAQMESGISGDQGATISGAMQAAKRRGCCLETTFPYPGRYTPTIPQAAHAEAKDHKLKNHAVLRDYSQCFNFLASGVGGIEIGIPWTSTLANNRTGVIESAGGQTYGGHALAIIGYTKRKDRQGRQYLLMFNSHGRQWAANGVAEIAPTLFDRWGQDRYSEMIGASDLEEFAPRKIDWTQGALV